jgi:hypothetical protein
MKVLLCALPDTTPRRRAWFRLLIVFLGLASTATAFPTTISVNNVSATETDAGTNFVFCVTLDFPSGRLFQVDYFTVDGDATSASDYQATAGTLQFNQGITKHTVSVAVYGDFTNECDEVFNIKLTMPSEAITIGSPGVGTIENDDTVDIDVLDAGQVHEGHDLIFCVTLTKASDKTITVNYYTTDGEATSRNDYLATEGTLSFDPGVTKLTVSVITLGDKLNECQEAMHLVLSMPAGVLCHDDVFDPAVREDVLIGDGGSADGFILATPDFVGVSVQPVPPAVEGSVFVFFVTLDAPSDQTIRVNYDTVQGTAWGGGRTIKIRPACWSRIIRGCMACWNFHRA